MFIQLRNVRQVWDKTAVTADGGGRNTGNYPRFPDLSMLDPAQQQLLVTRLNRVEGQVRGIKRMVQEPRLCLEILQQLSAAEAALNRVSLAILRYHVEDCVPKGVEQSPEEGRVRLKELIDIFDRFST
jgi:DNA-binding FrmR family transcriptional regulator